VKVILVIFLIFSLNCIGQNPIPMGHYDLYSIIKGEKLVFDKDRSQVLHEVFKNKEDLDKSESDSLVKRFQELYFQTNLHFFNERTLFWNSISEGVDGWHNELKGCGYEIDLETARIQISTSTSTGYSGLELFHFELNQDSLVLIPLKGTVGRIVYLKRKELEFTAPWKQDNPSIIIDAYGPNPINWEEMEKDTNVIGVIHKCSEGLTVDKKYKERSEKAKELNYLWGSYHLGRSGNPIEQAKFYLAQVEDLEKDLIALDLEDIDNPKFMNLENALIFIDYVRENTGRYPVLYFNNSVLNQINEKYGTTSSFSKCPLWYARFKSEVTDFNSTTWSSYTFWQFSCEINCEKTGECLYNVPGCEFDMDVNIFNGNHQEIQMLWPFRYR
jgi:lysozyme